MRPLAERLAEACAHHAGRTALDDGDIRMDYAGLLHTADEIAGDLARRGLEAAELVPIAVSNRAADVAALLGIWRAGGVAVPLHRHTPRPVAAALVRRVDARMQVNARPDLPAPFATGPVIGPLGPAPVARPLLRGAAQLVFTSGSSGEPKGVVLSDARLGAKLDMIASQIGIEDGERTLLALQLTFSFGQWVMATTLLAGGTLVLRSRFDAAGFVDDLQCARIDRAPAVPTMLRALLPLAECGRGRNWAGTVVAGGEVLPAPLGLRLAAAWPRATILDVYGLTETGTSDFFVAAGEYQEAAGTIGRAGRGIEWRIDARGELQIKSPFGMLGYIDDAAKTAAAFDGEYFRTGDLASVRRDGRVELVGRVSEMIVRAGNKIAPLEVERVFLGHPDVEAALATGIADPDTGEAVHLLIVPRAGRDPDPARLRDWAGEHLERWKLPDRIHVGTDLPVGRTGKADRRALARLIAGTGSDHRPV